MAKKISINEEELKRLYYEENKSVKFLSDYFNVAKCTIIRRLKKLEVPIKTSTILNRKYNVDETYFENINTKQKAYLLGFICADGWVVNSTRSGNPSALGLSLSKKDIEIVELLKHEISSEHPIKIKKDKNNGNEYATLYISSVKIAKDLIRMGVHPNKSLDLNLKKVSEYVPDNFKKYLLLGYFDGDGCITSALGQNRKTVLWQLSVTGTKETGEYFKEFFDSHGFFTKRHKDDKNNYTFMISGKNLVYQALSKLYDEDTSFCLQRKYKKYLTIKSPIE